MNFSEAIAGVSVALASLQTDFDDVDQPFEEGKLVKALICAGLSILASAAAAAHATEVISPGNRAAYCRGEVSQQYGTKPIYVKTGKLKKDKDGATSVSGTVDKGDEGIKQFKCRFDAKGAFVDVMALTSDGE